MLPQAVMPVMPAVCELRGAVRAGFGGRDSPARRLPAAAVLESAIFRLPDNLLAKDFPRDHYREYHHAVRRQAAV